MLRSFYFLFLSFFFSASIAIAQSDKSDSAVWDPVKKLTDEQKTQAALELTKEILKKAKSEKKSLLWAEAIIKVSQLEMSLGGFETAVNHMKDQEWPSESEAQFILQLYYAQTLIQYTRGYRWEILRREKVESKKAIDLKAWTLADISLQIRKSLDAVMAEPKILNRPLTPLLKEYISLGNYPENIKPWARHAILDIAFGFLVNTTFWTPTQLAEKYKVSYKTLIQNPRTQRIAAADQNAHPIEIIASWISEQRILMLNQGMKESALESQYELFEKLYELSQDQDQKEFLLTELLKFQSENKSNNWWSRGQALVARFYQEQPNTFPKRMIDAIQAAEAGVQAYPESIGAKQCRHIIASIRVPTFSLNSMYADGAQKKSVVLTYRNFKKIYWRAYKVDPAKALPRYRAEWFLETPENYDYTKILANRPQYEWSADLPETKDYLDHEQFQQLPMVEKGYYLVFASQEKDFVRSGKGGTFQIGIFISDIVLSFANVEDRKLEVHIKTGTKGQPVADAQVDLYRFDYNNKNATVVSSAQTNKEGIVKFSEPARDSNHYWNYFVAAKKDDSFIATLSTVNFSRMGEGNPYNASLIFTDRAVYRPGQKILVKIACFKGFKDSFKSVEKDTEFTVSLRDPNYQEVGKLKLKANGFGTASGEFVIPSGRPLGYWSVQSSFSGSASIRVEEYKRPTFEVSLKDPEIGLRLNKKAVLRGEAKYYFGQAVTNGKLRYRISRSQGMVYDWISRWMFYGHQSQVQVAQGEATVDGQGNFSIEFTPQVEEKLAKRDDRLNYTYHVQVDLTDEGGETRSAQRSYRIGFLTLEARLRLDKAVYAANDVVEVQANLSQLDGKARSGNAQFKLFELNQPAKTSLPAELPKDEMTLSPYQQGDDLKRARFETQFENQSVMAKWSEGALVQSGKFEHKANGQAVVQIKEIRKKGAYRIQYEVKDDYDKTFKTTQDFIVGGESGPALPLVLLVQEYSYEVGGKAKVYVRSGFADQDVEWEIYRNSKRLQRKVLKPSEQGFIEIPITREDRGGFAIRAHILRDYQSVELRQMVIVPWTDNTLKVEVATMRDKVRPGSTETVRLTIKDSAQKLLKAGTAEVLAAMYDRSLDLFAPHEFRSFAYLYPSYGPNFHVSWTLGQRHGNSIFSAYNEELQRNQGFYFQDARLEVIAGYGIGGLGGVNPMVAGRAAAAPAAEKAARSDELVESDGAEMHSAIADAPAESEERKRKEKAPESPAGNKADGPGGKGAPVQLRTNFSETAFFKPHLMVDEKGSVSFEYQVPDSLTSWKFLVQAMTKDLVSGVSTKEVQSVKDLMVRPYLPRFLREGDLAELKVVINNSSDKKMDGQLKLEIENPETGKSVASEFGLNSSQLAKTFQVKAQDSTSLSFSLKAPAKIGVYSFRVVAESKGFSDGEQRELPVLPSRMHLAQSRFVSLKGMKTRTVEFPDMKADQDKSLIHEKLVATVDAQLFFNVLQALPSILKSPYDCTEVVLNRFVSTGILSSFYGQYPDLAKMSKQFSNRRTQLEKFDESDANRRMTLEESPWLLQAQGGDQEEAFMLNVLDPKVASVEQQKALSKLKKMQLDSGGFPWFEGGRPDEFMTLYILIGLSRALEFKVDVPKSMVESAWKYTHWWLNEALKNFFVHDVGWEFVSTLLFALTSYPDDSWSGNRFPADFREKLLNFSFKHWKDHTPRTKAYLSLALHRMKRPADAKLVWDSVMDSSKTTEDLGTFWAREDRSWIWYRDTIESEAFSLRTLMELSKKDPRSEGMVQWLFLNKKMNQWKSTRATAEVIYSLAKYLEEEKSIGIKEEVAVDMGTQQVNMVFTPDKFSGKKNQIVISGEKVNPAKNSQITFQNKSPNLAFASATWHFSTEKLPEKGDGDFLSVERSYYLRENKASKGQPPQWVLKPLKSGDAVKVGDQVEVQLSMRSEHEAEYIHLRDPRAAGLEPESVVSGHKWEMGLSWYEETRDSGSNFFISQLPVGEYNFRYRLRANMAGVFRLAPATLQSFYAPEFNAYSAGFILKVSP